MKKPEKELEAADAQKRENRLYAEKVRALHRQIPSGIFPAYLSALGYAWVVWNTLPHRNIVIWLFIQTVALAGRAYLYRSFKQKDDEIALHRWKINFTLLTWLTGAAWGAAALFLFPEKPALQIFLILLIGGLAAGTAGLYAVFLEIVSGFIVFSLSPFVVHYLVFQSDTVPRWMALFIAIYGAAMIFTARRVRESVTRALELAEDLKVEIGERQRVETALKVAHDELDLRVRQRTAELSEANATLGKLNNAIEQASEMVVMTDLDGRIEYVNPAAEKTSGYAARELLGQPFQMFQQGEEKDELLDNIFQTLRAEKHWKGEVLNKKKSGGSYLAAVTMSAVYDARGEMTHYTAIMRDESERKKLEQDLLQSSKLSSLGTLVSGIAHELNTPLATILGFSEEIAKGDQLSSSSKKYVDWIIKESKRCASIVRQLLKFSHHYEAKRMIFNLNEAVSSVLPLYQYRLRSDFIKVETDLQKAPLPVFGDQEQLQQVILNILQNAHQAIKRQKGIGIIHVKTEQSASEAQISITNNGPAIPSDALEKIFDPFFTTKNVGEGTGLGLSLSYSIIEEHHGRIQVENLKEGGVCFVISIPISDAARDESNEDKVQSILPLGLKILIVEDDERLCEWLALFLRGEGALVTTATNGLEAIDRLKNCQPDLIVSDLKMPKMNGIELCQWLEKHRREYLQRFILLTGVVDSDFNDFCKLRDIPILLKPVDKKELILTLNKVEERIHVQRKWV